MSSTVICFSGPIGSGKTTLSKNISGSLGWPIASFGAYVRVKAKEFGYELTRAGLQSTSDLLIKRGWSKFCTDFLVFANWDQGSNLIIDGVRHIEALEALKELIAPTRIYLVYVSIVEDERNKRLVQRNLNNGNHDLEKIEQHPSEIQVKREILSRADLVIDNNCSLESVTEKLVNWIRSLG